MSIHDEFEFIKQITPKHQLNSDVIVGIGDDAAIIRPYTGKDVIACTDTMVEEVHFSRITMSPFHIGYKALAANISDVAAMGGTPKFYLVSLVVPTSWSEEELVEIYKGMEELAQQYQMVLIGGDTVSTSGPLVVNVMVMGSILQDKSLKRSDALPGDLVFLTGTVGDSAAGLHILLNEKDSNEYLVKRHQLPTPQGQAGILLSNLGRVALNDISDGVASEAIEIAEASQVDIELDASLIPLSAEILTFGHEQAINWALYGGEDYELIGTISSEKWSELERVFAQDDIKITKIGKVIRGSGNVSLKSGDSVKQLKKQGYNHFKHGDHNEN
ncbi:thiamine-monophosphate kinase [Bacillus mesophilus]|uniref:Thiamine-monophosphate kinase n=1 Tax=Bacillus mesophilus TaxID=1808955 RepID=A0A6M0QFD2_9BACI|nr:thiamine-phosphate kinase [Bacillus mesophilus]MBM7663317.1 thiamine-monophosphate kinase [Bacillus mesophilus]NEY74098.1 thiamine-phosphate kinase [Bacillus mesophilus]